MNTSIIIPTTGNLEHLRNCLTSIIQYTSFHRQAVEVVVVLNAEPNVLSNASAYISGLNNQHIKTVIFDSPIGFPRAINEGAKCATGDALVLLNDDIVFTDQPINEWLVMLTKPFAQTGVDVVGPLSITSPHTGKDYISFFCAAIRKTTFTKLGGLDERFSPGWGEDADFCFRVGKIEGQLVKVPQGQDFGVDDSTGRFKSAFPIKHVGEATFGSLSDIEGIIQRNSSLLKSIASDTDFPTGTLSSSQLASLLTLTDSIPDNGTIVHLNMGEGLSLCYVASIIHEKSLRVMAVDQCSNSFVSHLSKYQLLNIVAMMKMPARFAVQVIPDKTFDMVFAQSNGEADTFRSEVVSWLPKLKPNGILVASESMADIPLPSGFAFEVHDTNSLWVIRNTKQVDIVIDDGKEVTAVVCTKGRLGSTLPLCIMGIATQTCPPTRIVVVDDANEYDISILPTVQSIISILSAKNIRWDVLRGDKRGRPLSSQQGLRDSKTPWIWRLSDDHVPESNALELLLKHTDDKKVGAIGGAVRQRDMKATPLSAAHSGKIEDVITTLNIQWALSAKVFDVDHLHSTFLYRKSAASHGFCRKLSPLGYRDDTIFTYQMKRAGWRLLVDSNVVTWHLRCSSGGNRTYQDRTFKEKDNEYFLSLLKQWNIAMTSHCGIALTNGIGDHFAFKLVYPEIKAYCDAHNQRMFVAPAYPLVFDDLPDFPLITIDEAEYLGLIGDHQNIYHYMTQREKEGKPPIQISEAFKEMYTCK